MWRKDYVSNFILSFNNHTKAGIQKPDFQPRDHIRQLFSIFLTLVKNKKQLPNVISQLKVSFLNTNLSLLHVVYKGIYKMLRHLNFFSFVICEISDVL